MRPLPGPCCNFENSARAHVLHERALARPLPELSPEEWADCRAAAREMTLVTGRRVSARDVAAEFVRARESEAESFRALLISR